MADKKQKKKPSKLESAGRGALQGISLGFADEIEGGAKALRDIVGPDANLSQLVDLYKQRRDESRQAYDEARQENPKSFIGGSLAGALGTALIPGASALGASNALKAAQMGAGFGALGGLGVSKGDNIQDIVKDVALGATVGGVTGPLSKVGFDKVKGLLSTEAAAIPKMSEEAARKAQKEMQQVMEEIGEGLARTSPKPVQVRTPQEADNIRKTIAKIEEVMPELRKQALARMNQKDFIRAQQERAMNPAEATPVIDLLKRTGNE